MNAPLLEYLLSQGSLHGMGNRKIVGSLFGNSNRGEGAIRSVSMLPSKDLVRTFQGFLKRLPRKGANHKEL